MTTTELRWWAESVYIYLLAIAMASSSEADKSTPVAWDRPVKNLYISNGVGYDESQVQRFVNNVLRYCSGCDVVVFVRHGLPNMTFEQPENVYVLEREEKGQRHVQRFMVIDRWLKRNTRPYAKVIFSDMRDLIVQTDPFKQIEADAVYTFEEQYDLKSEEYNKGWLKGCYGEEYLKSLIATDMKVICVGVVMGSLQAMKDYFSAFTTELAKHRDNADQTCYRRIFGVNTAVHYKVILDILKQRGTNVVIVKESQGYTSHRLKLPITRDTLGRALNARGEPFAIVHHADRHPVLFSEYEKRYPYIKPNTVIT